MTNINNRISILITLLLCVFVGLILIHPIGDRVGDGMEYYAMLISIINSGQVFATHESLLLYDNYVAHTSSLGFLQSEFLHTSFPMLESNGELVFPHFWFYSVLAAPFGMLLKIASLDIGYSFTLLHISLFMFLLYIAHKEYSKLGVIVVLILILFSPAIWFINKAHTEFFTITMSIAGIIYFIKNKYLQSSLFFALIATQNPPFAIISILLIGYALFNMKSKLFHYKSIAFLTVILTIIALHPLYYYFRLGVITPQFLMGTANDPVTLHRMLTWFVDPDVGLFLNWPLGLIALLVGLFYLANSNIRSFLITYKFHLLFYVLYVIILSYAQSKTGNLNHGGSVNISRYALWYIALFFPLITYLLQKFYSGNLSFCKRNLITFLLAAIGIINIFQYLPNKSESYINQTKASKAFYKTFPHLWEPEPEIFVERALGREGIPNNWAIFRDNKILINRDVLESLKMDDIPLILNAQKIDPTNVYKKASELKTNKKFFYIYGPFDNGSGLLKEYKVNIELVNKSELVCLSEQECKIPLKITNMSSTTWPANNEDGNNVSLSYHIAKKDGMIVVADGSRISFPHDISSGVSIPRELILDSQLLKGEYILMIDLVHEHVTWFGAKDPKNILSITLKIN